MRRGVDQETVSVHELCYIPVLQHILVYTARTLLIVPCPRHIPITRAAISNEEHFRSDLSTKKASLVVPDFLPLREVVWHLGELDTCRRLRMTGVQVVRAMHRVTHNRPRRMKLWVLSCSRRE